MKHKISKFLRRAIFVFNVLVVLASAALMAYIFVAAKRLENKNKAPAADCSAVVAALKGRLPDRPKTSNDYAERAKVFNRASLEACDDVAKNKYFSLALTELQIADSVAALKSANTDVSRAVGHYWKERAEFYNLHDMKDEELEIYKKYIALPGRSRDVYVHAKIAALLGKYGNIRGAILSYSDVSDICRTANNSNCYIAISQFADLLEETPDPDVVAELNARWKDEKEFSNLFRYNGDAGARIRRVLGRK